MTVSGGCCVKVVRLSVSQGCCVIVVWLSTGQGCCMPLLGVLCDRHFVRGVVLLCVSSHVKSIHFNHPSQGSSAS